MAPAARQAQKSKADKKTVTTRGLKRSHQSNKDRAETTSEESNVEADEVREVVELDSDALDDDDTPTTTSLKKRKRARAAEKRKSLSEDRKKRKTAKKGDKKQEQSEDEFNEFSDGDGDGVTIVGRVVQAPTQGLGQLEN